MSKEKVSDPIPKNYETIFWSRSRSRLESVSEKSKVRAGVIWSRSQRSSKSESPEIGVVQSRSHPEPESGQKRGCAPESTSTVHIRSKQYCQHKKEVFFRM